MEKICVLKNRSVQREGDGSDDIYIIKMQTVNLNNLMLERAERLSSVTKHLEKSAEYPLLKVIPIDPIVQARIVWSVNFYLWVSLVSAFPDQHFHLAADMLAAYPEQITRLPNITPNGLVLPKKENYLAYHEVQKAIAIMFRQLKIDAHVDRIHVPVNIRIVSGLSNPEIDNRPRSSCKPHSDIWAGEPGASIMFFLALLGDVSAAGIRFFEPADFPKEFLQSLPDYNLGRRLMENSIEYDARLQFGKVFISDPWLIHQTVKQAKGLRLSIDFRFLAAQKIASDCYDGASRMKNYVPLKEWYEFGFNRLAMTNDSLTPSQYADKVKDSYAVDFNFIQV